MTVADNVAYGLMIRQVPRAERLRRAAEMLELVRMPGIGDRKPAQLAGGPRQGDALARALINEPPATTFVAGFVGSSNLISDGTAAEIAGSPQTFSVRAEKIRLMPPGGSADDSFCVADGESE